MNKDSILTHMYLKPDDTNKSTPIYINSNYVENKDMIDEKIIYDFCSFYDTDAIKRFSLDIMGNFIVNGGKVKKYKLGKIQGYYIPSNYFEQTYCSEEGKRELLFTFDAISHLTLRFWEYLQENISNLNGDFFYITNLSIKEEYIQKDIINSLFDNFANCMYDIYKINTDYIIANVFYSLNAADLLDEVFYVSEMAENRKMKIIKENNFNPLASYMPDIEIYYKTIKYSLDRLY